MTNPQITESHDPMPIVLRLFENALRSGYNLLQALDIIAREVQGPMASEIRIVLADVAAGSALPDALAAWLQRTPSQELDLMLAAIYVQMEAGGNLADKLNLLAQLLEKRTLTSA